jgi:hypothetical protein
MCACLTSFHFAKMPEMTEVQVLYCTVNATVIINDVAAAYYSNLSRVQEVGYYYTDKGYVSKGRPPKNRYRY